MLVNGVKRDRVIDVLKNEGIDVRPFFIPLSEMEIYQSYLFSNQNSKDISRRGIMLPTADELSLDIVENILFVLSKELIKINDVLNMLDDSTRAKITPLKRYQGIILGISSGNFIWNKSPCRMEKAWKKNL